MASVVFYDKYQVSGVGTFEQNVRVNYTETSYDVANNRTLITINSVQIASSRSMGECPIFGTLQVNGSTIVTFNGGSANTATLNGSVTSYSTITGFSSATLYVSHDSLGAASMTVSLTGGQNGVFGARYNNKMFGVRTTASKSVALTTHPRASAIASCTSPVSTTNGLTLTVNRNSTAFYHKATFSIGGTTLYTSSAFATSLSYTIPRTWFSSYGSVSSLTVTVSVQTYTDANCTTTVGSAATTTITVNADADMKPSVSAGWASLAAYNTGAVSGMTGYIKGYSKAEATFDSTKIDMSNAVGATISSYSVTCQGTTVSASPYRTPVISSVSTSVVCTVTDSRGRTASESIDLTVMDYSAPVLTAQEIFRCNSLGVADEDGTYISVKTTLTYSSLNSQNSCSLTAAIAASGGSYGAENNLTSGTASVLGTVSADTSYTVRITATDTLGNTAVYYSSVPSRKWAMKFRSNGRGVAFGKAAETDYLFEITPDWDVQIGGDLTVLGNINGGGGGGGCAMYFPSQTVNVATNAEIFRITSAAITTQTVLVECTFASPAYITSDVTWTSYDGYIAFYGTCTSATTADVTLSNVETPSPQTPLAIANGGTGANTAAGALTNLGLATALKYIGTNPSGYNINTASNASGYGWMNYGQVSGDFPNNVGYGMLVHLKGDNDTAIQLYINDSHFCTRQYANSSWSAWRIL